MGEEGEEQVEVGLEEGEPAGLKKQILDESNRWKMVTLEVHSSLLAVGFIAAISARFRDRGTVAYTLPHSLPPLHTPENPTPPW